MVTRARLNAIVRWVHRWTGLAIAGFLIVAGVTGSVLVFQYELDAWLNPSLFRTTGDGAPLPPAMLVARVERFEPRLQVTSVPLRVAPGETAMLGVRGRRDPATGRFFALGYDQLFADPVDGRVVGVREADEAFVPTIHSLHYTLLAGGWGKLAMGAVAVLWVANAVLGVWLTLPSSPPWLERWKPAWLIRARSGSYRRNLDLHRAGSLWFWLPLFLLAVSSVYMNLQFELFRPVLSWFSTPASSIYEPVGYQERLQRQRDAPDRRILSLDEVVAFAVTEGHARAWSRPPNRVTYLSGYAAFSVAFRDSQYTPGSGLGDLLLYLDDSDGHVLRAVTPGRGSAADVVLQLQSPLHSGRIAGWTGRIIVFVSGLVIAVVAFTGVVIWWKKRALHQRARNSRATSAGAR